MKILLIISLLFVSISCFAQSKDTAITKTDSINLRQIKNCLAFDREIKRSFDGLIDAWYKMDRSKGIPSDKAFRNTMDRVAAKLNYF